MRDISLIIPRLLLMMLLLLLVGKQHQQHQANSNSKSFLLEYFLLNNHLIKFNKIFVNLPCKFAFLHRRRRRRHLFHR